MITVTGASDDLIEVDGDIIEEFSALDTTVGGYLGFSNGVLLRAVYDNDGIWRITPIVGEVKIVYGSVLDDTNDVATLMSPADWVVFGDTWAGGRPKTGEILTP